MSLNIAADHVALGYLGRGRRITRSLPWRQITNAPALDAVDKATWTVACADVDGSSLSEQLMAAWGQSAKDGSFPSRGGHLQVRLGMRHGHVGIMMLREREIGEYHSDQLDEMAAAWAKHRWGLQLDHQIVRAHQFHGLQLCVVSCVRRDIFVATSDFARQTRLKFVSCMPAALQPLWGCLARWHAATANAATQPRRDQAWIWSESACDGARPAPVMMVHWTRSLEVAQWRGLLAAPAAAAAGDPVLQGPVRRFLAGAAAGSDTPLLCEHWDTRSHPPAWDQLV